MADVTISSLPLGTPLGNLILPISDGNNTYGAPLSDIQVNYNSIINKPTIPTINSSQLARAWVCFDGTGSNGTNQTIRASYNVSSVFKNGGGNYSINFPVGVFPDGNITVVGTYMHVPNVSWGGAAVPSSLPQPTVVYLYTADHGKGLVNSSHVSVVCYR